MINSNQKHKNAANISNINDHVSILHIYLCVHIYTYYAHNLYVILSYQHIIILYHGFHKGFPVTEETINEIAAGGQPSSCLAAWVKQPVKAPVV